MRGCAALFLTLYLLRALVAEANSALSGLHVWLFAGGLFVVYSALMMPFGQGFAASVLGGLLCDSVTPVAFSDYYTFSQAYNLEGPLAASLPELYPALLASNAAKTQYQGAFYSGNNLLNPINSTSWPVYWCGIGIMTGPELVKAVNNF